MIKDEPWVEEHKLFPFPVQDDVIAEDEAAFNESLRKIKGILKKYRSQTSLPVFVAQVQCPLLPPSCHRRRRLQIRPHVPGQCRPPAPRTPAFHQTGPMRRVLD